ncbi:BMP family ABC transporter substrate-binding protein [Cohnella pontilimi]|uniref:BMP family ABC transporter substrate-binding protein n=1 Tax=Cohnella pontilimi TaxID=2564100 RepID=A0A4U0F7B0_9BACL|nr:BMP family ABC transporter substrate-binding protein [Cohnella pontilimi]
MKKLWSACLLLLSIAVITAGCGGKSGDSEKSSNSSGGGDIKSAVYYVNGTLGDKGFFDSAQAGFQKAGTDLGIDIKTVEGGNNQADWASSLESLVASKKYDVVLTGTIQMVDIVKDLAKRYPDQKFIFFDEVINDIPNVYSMLYSQSEGSFLAGAFAALVTTSTELKGANPDKVIGFVGGVDDPIVNDFKSGYEQGAQYIDKDVKIITSYVGDWSNAPKAKELTLAQYNTQKADIVYQVAGGAGLGTLEAGNEAGKYSIGVDANQNPLYPGSVLTSMLKNIDTSVFRAFQLLQQGKLPLGKTEVLGLKEGGVGIAKDDLYAQYVPKSIQDKIAEIEKKLSTGEIKVESTL